MDKNVLSTFFLKYHQVLIAFAKRRIWDGNQAEDSVSETYLRLLENWEKFNELYNEESCLKLAKSILFNVICDESRKRKRAKKFAQSQKESLKTFDEDEDFQLDASSLMDKIVKMVELTEKELTILPFVIKGYPNREIAKMLGVTSEEVGKARFTLTRKLKIVVQRNPTFKKIYFKDK